MRGEDWVQEAYARAWQRWGSLSCYDDPEAWVRTVAYRIGVDNWRRALRSVVAYRRHGVADDLPETDPDRIAIIGALRQHPVAPPVRAHGEEVASHA